MVTRHSRATELGLCGVVERKEAKDERGEYQKICAASLRANEANADKLEIDFYFVPDQFRRIHRDEPETIYEDCYL